MTDGPSLAAARSPPDCPASHGMLARHPPRLPKRREGLPRDAGRLGQDMVAPLAAKDCAASMPAGWHDDTGRIAQKRKSSPLAARDRDAWLSGTRAYGPRTPEPRRFEEPPKMWTAGERRRPAATQGRAPVRHLQPNQTGTHAVPSPASPPQLKSAEPRHGQVAKRLARIVRARPPPPKPPRHSQPNQMGTHAVATPESTAAVAWTPTRSPRLDG